MTFTAFDIVMLVLFTAIVIKVTLTGFINEFFSKAAVIIGAACAVIFFRKLSSYVAKLSGGGFFPDAVAFLLIFLVAYVMVKLLQNVAGSATENESMHNLDHALGFFLGVVEGLLVIVVILVVIGSMTWFDVSFLTKDSFIARVLKPVVSGAPGFFAGMVPSIGE